MANKPTETLRDGQLKATIWERSSEKGVFFSVELTRSYRDKDGKWHDHTGFVGDELLRIARLAGKAYDRTAELRQQARDNSEAGPNDGRLS